MTPPSDPHLRIDTKKRGRGVVFVMTEGIYITTTTRGVIGAYTTLPVGEKGVGDVVSSGSTQTLCYHIRINTQVANTVF